MASALVVLLLASCSGGDAPTPDGNAAATTERTGATGRTGTTSAPSAPGDRDAGFVVGEPFDLLAGPNRGEKRRFDVNVDHPRGTPFAMIRFDPAGSVLAAEASDLPGAAAEVGPAGCVPTTIEASGGTGEACFDDEGGLGVIVVPDIGSFRISIACGTIDELDAMLDALDLVDVAGLAPVGDEELPREAPVLQGCTDAPGKA